MGHENSRVVMGVNHTFFCHSSPDAQDMLSWGAGEDGIIAKNEGDRFQREMDCRQQRSQGMRLHPVEEAPWSPLCSEEQPQGRTSRTEWRNQQWLKRSLQHGEESDGEKASSSSSVVFIEEQGDVCQQGNSDIECGSDVEDAGEVSAQVESTVGEESLGEDTEVVTSPEGPLRGDGLSAKDFEEITHRGEGCDEPELFPCPEGSLVGEVSEEEETEVLCYMGGSPVEKMSTMVDAEMILDPEGSNGADSEEVPCWGGAALGEADTEGEAEAIVFQDRSPIEEGSSGEEPEEIHSQQDCLSGNGSDEETVVEWAMPVEDLVAKQRPSKPRHICSECGRSLASHSALVRHGLIHTGELPYACTECGRRFRQSSALVRHLRAHRGERPYVCGECGKAFGVRSALVRHQRALHTSERPYVCGECGKAYADLSILTKHQLIHINGRPFSCPDCGQSFGHRTTLTQHRRIHTEERPYRCTECGQTFRQNSALANHRQVHSGKRPFSCQYCGKSFAGRPTLVQHLRTHTGEKPYSCPDCGRQFSTSSNLLQHRRNHLGERPFACSLCGRRFARRPDLARHYVTHAEGSVRPHRCGDCGRRFVELVDLEQHQATHRGERPYVCSFCGKSFTEAGTLARHRRSHLPTAEQVYRCEECGQTFGQSSDLLAHGRVHSGERPYACADCGKTFGRSSNLSRHQRVHTHERPYVCGDCGKSYTQSTHLMEHQRQHTGERPYECTDCGRSFGKKGHLDSHRRVHRLLPGSREATDKSLMECSDLGSPPDV
ncbi:zinc finger protein 345-like isoform X1 [Hemicordylus capensis]|uniref:zinc finger protein 345-like isoform X1 n=2 Tax=Hemicordylus capensis TaxID=884348 RepID=UPI002304A0FC|nr:zinc finger protein 345-like isoform X1 [Hemicordylus capensis]